MNLEEKIDKLLYDLTVVLQEMVVKIASELFKLKKEPNFDKIVKTHVDKYYTEASKNIDIIANIYKEKYNTEIIKPKVPPLAIRGYPPIYVNKKRVLEYNETMYKRFLDGETRESIIQEMWTHYIDEGITIRRRTRNYSPEVSARMDLAYVMNDNANKNAEKIAKEIKADGYEVSMHPKPRPSHVFMQGNRYSISEFNSFVKDKLLEPHCYHYAFPIIFSTSEPIYTVQERIEQIQDDNERIEYKGKYLTGYEQLQKQRYMERNIRKYKERYVIAKESGNKALMKRYKDKVKYYQKEYKSISSLFDLPVLPHRTRYPYY